MIRNYLIITWKILNRNKFFTFVSLFGISFTLMILIVIAAFYDSSFGPHGPEKKLDRLFFVPGATFTHDKARNSSKGSTSRYFFNKTLKKTKTPENISIVSLPGKGVSYVNNKKISLMSKFCDAEFWQILDFTFISGKPFTKNDVDQARKTVVLSKQTSLDYFGHTQSTGKSFIMDGEVFHVNGVVEDVSITKIYSFAEVYLPYTVSGEDFSAPRISGDYIAIVLAGNKSDHDQINAEYKSLMKNFPFPNPERYNRVQSWADPMIPGMIRILTNSESDTNIYIFNAIIIAIILLFMSFPSINLVNINISRIIERASEIGIRRSFGASIKKLMVQFMVENIIITFLGGIIGFVFALIVIYIINTRGVIPDFFFTINYQLIFYTIGLTLFFGLFSGLYPAWRMSKLNIVNALKTESI